MAGTPLNEVLRRAGIAAGDTGTVAGGQTDAIPLWPYLAVNQQQLPHCSNRLGYGNNAVQTVTVKLCNPGE